MDRWAGKKIVVEQIWGEGGTLWLKPKGVPHAEFTLHRADHFAGNHPERPRYLMKFSAGHMTDPWASVWLIKSPTQPTPSAAAAKLQGHPQGQACVDVLEGFMPVIYQGKPRVDHVLMSYYENAPVSGKTGDLVVINLSFADAGTVQPLEDGGGSGPPK